MKIVEIRSYNLKSGTRDDFHELMLKESLPMLREWQVDVVRFGASTHDKDSYYLMRAYNDLQDRQASQDAFYGSDAWKNGPREAIVSKIESYTSVVLDMTDDMIDGLRK